MLEALQKQIDDWDPYGANLDVNDWGDLLITVKEVVKEMRTTDCDGRDIPRFADRLEGKSNE